MTWTRFMDMHSGGGLKEKFSYCYIEAPEAEARCVFYHRFGHNPSRVSCTCCGDDYSIDEEESLARATAYERGLRYVEDVRGKDGLYQGEGWQPGFYIEPGEPVPEGRALSSMSSSLPGPGVALDAYLKSEGIHVIYAADIKPEERTGEIPEEGYAWK